MRGRYGLLLGAMLVGSAVVATPSIALACGGCFGPVESNQVVTNHRMVMAVHPTQSILWDQFRYTGSPSEFSWVLPVNGDVRVELASNDFFERLDQLTTVQVQAPIVQTVCNGGGRALSAPNAASDASASRDAGVEILREEVVGPYETVLLRSDSADALATWLRSNNFVIPTSIEPTIRYYNDLRMNFIALRLRPGFGVSQMSPIRIRYASANMVLPLRMVAAGVGDKVGITLFVFGRGRHEAANFANGVIDPNSVVWDWDNNRSNYRQVFDQRLTDLGGRAWITEYVQPANSISWNFQYDNRPWQPDAGSTDGGGDGGTPEPSVRDDWNLATRDGDTTVTVTRMRTDLLAQFLNTDLTLQASATDVSVSNVIQATRTTGTSPAARCPPDTAISLGGGAGLRCSAAPGSHSRSPGGWLVFGALGLAGTMGFVRSRRRR